MRDTQTFVLGEDHPESARGCIAFKCEACNAKVVIKLPVSSEEFGCLGKDFCKRHRDCAVNAKEAT